MIVTLSMPAIPALKSRVAGATAWCANVAEELKEEYVTEEWEARLEAATRTLHSLRGLSKEAAVKSLLSRANEARELYENRTALLAEAAAKTTTSVTELGQRSRRALESAAGATGQAATRGIQLYEGRKAQVVALRDRYREKAAEAWGRVPTPGCARAQLQAAFEERVVTVDLSAVLARQRELVAVVNREAIVSRARELQGQARLGVWTLSTNAQEAVSVRWMPVDARAAALLLSVAKRLVDLPEHAADEAAPEATLLETTRAVRAAAMQTATARVCRLRADVVTGMQRVEKAGGLGIEHLMRLLVLVRLSPAA